MCLMSSSEKNPASPASASKGQKNEFYRQHIQPVLQDERDSCFHHCGGFSVAGLTKAMHELRGCLVDFPAKFQFNLNAVFIELYQNIEAYGLKLPDGNSEDAFGCITLSGRLSGDDSTENYLRLQAINITCRSDEITLRDRLSTLSSLDRKELAARYRAQLASLAPISALARRRTGLGLLDMARRVNGQFSFTLDPIDDDHCLLILEAEFYDTPPHSPEKRIEKMQPFILRASSRSPEVTLQPADKKLWITGESYPENVTAFYVQLETALKEYFTGAPESLEVEITLRYFNSGSAHALLNILRMLDKYAQKGCVITLIWKVFVDDDIGREFAQDIAEQAPSLFLTIAEIKEESL